MYNVARHIEKSHKGSYPTDADEVYEALCVAPLEAGPAVRSELTCSPLQLAPGVSEGVREGSEGGSEEGSTEEGKNGRESKHSNSIATEEREI